MRRPGLADLTAFLAIVEHGGFRPAAAALEVSPSALSHAMRALEARLGARLLNRTTRSVSLTEAGRRLAAEVGPALRTIDKAMEGLADEEGPLRGRIRINAPEHGAKILLGAAVAHFADAHPEVEVEIATDDAFVDIVHAGFDAGVRLHEAVPQDMVAVSIGPDAGLIVVASPTYLASRSHPVEPLDLLDHRCVRFRLAGGTLHRWEFEREGRSVLIDAPGPLTLDNMNAVVEAALQGLGPCLLWSYLVADHLAAGRLVQLLADWSPTIRGPCLYYPPQRHAPRAFAEFVRHLRRGGAVIPISAL